MSEKLSVLKQYCMYEYRYTVLKTDGNGKFVRAMGHHGFPGIFPVKHLLSVWHAAAFMYPAVCNGSTRESSLHSKQACRPSVSRCPKSACDKSSVADLIGDFSNGHRQRGREAW